MTLCVISFLVKTLIIFCECTSQLVLNLVRIQVDMFSHDTAHPGTNELSDAERENWSSWIPTRSDIFRPMQLPKKSEA